MRLAAFLFLVPLLLIGGCATRGLGQGRAPRRATIYFATDRKRLAAPGLAFGGERNEPPGLHLGSEEALIGPEHRLGQVDGAVTMLPVLSALARKTDPSTSPVNALHRTDAEIEAFAERGLRSAVHAALPAKPGGKRQVLLFIHGFNTTFDEAMRKTAQLAGDLDLLTPAGKERGVPIAYSWPAEGKLLGYFADEENVEWTQQRLEPFLRALARVCREEHADLEIIAHSMGARLLVRALSDIANSCEDRRGSGKLVDQVVLLAPDIGKGIFDQYVERILPLIGHLTIYVSAKDRALSLSGVLHGGHYRLGFIESSVLAALQLTGLTLDKHRELGYFPPGSGENRIDMIDVTGGLAASLGHSYEDPRFIGDLRQLIDYGTPAGTGGRSGLIYRELKPGLFHGATGERLRYFKLP
jgi:esterase/lipase superfamily enzyme